MPFVFLTSQNNQFLLDRSNAKAKIGYIDCLAMLHDILVNFSSAPGHPVFDYFLQPVSPNTVRSLLLTNPFPADIKRNLEINTDIAADLQNVMMQSAGESLVPVRDRIDEYIERLLTQY
jgi:hypothetical protein